MAVSLEWLVDAKRNVVLAHGIATVDRGDLEDWLVGTIEQGARHCAKLIDLIGCALVLDREDLDSVARWFLSYHRRGETGPVALVVHGALNIDFAILLKQRIDIATFRVFTDRGQAMAWLSATAETLAA